MNLSFQTLIIAALLALSLVTAREAHADAALVSFCNFKSDALYEAWAAGAKPAPVIKSAATNYAITATGYGVNWKYLGGQSFAAGCTAIELDVTLDGPAAADGQLGPIVDLIDGDGTRNSYRWYGQSLGHHVLTLPLDAPTEVVKPGSSAGLNLAALQHLHLSLDPGQFGKAAPYTITFNSLKLTGSGGESETSAAVVTADNSSARTLVSFCNFKSDAFYEAWAAVAKPAPVIKSTATNYAITATGYGVNWKYLGGQSSAAGCTAIELDVTLDGPAAADGQLGPIVDLIDGDGTRNSYRWYGQSLGHHVLTLPLDAPTEVVKPGSSAGLNLAALQHLHLSLDPGQFGKAAPYTITFNSLKLTGSGGETAKVKP